MDALNGNESVRLRETKLLFGLARGGVVAEIRKSTSCIQGFLLVTALKLCSYEDKTVAEVLYRMLEVSGDMKTTPVSSKQLQALVTVMSGHSQGFVTGSGSETIDKVVHAVAELCTTPVDMASKLYWERGWLLPSQESLADLLVKAFDGIQNEDIQHVELIGCQGFVWIITILYWLNSDNVALFYEATCFLGASHSKVRIVVDPSKMTGTPSEQQESAYSNSDMDWTVRTWKRGDCVASLVRPLAHGQSFFRFNACGKIPTNACRQYYLTITGSELFVNVLATMTESFVQIAIEFAVIASKGWGIENRVNALIRRGTFGERGSVVKLFGWDESNFLDEAELPRTDKGLEQLEAFWAKVSNYELPLLGRVNELEEKDVRQVVAEAWTVGRDPRNVTAVDSAMVQLSQLVDRLATHAFILAFLQFQCGASDEDPTTIASKKLYYYPHQNFELCLQFWNLQPIGLRDTPRVLLVFDPDLLVSYVLRHAATTGSSRLDETLAATFDGCTFVLAALFQHSTNLSGLLDIAVLPGAIYFDDRRYERLVEEEDRSIRFGIEEDAVGEVIMAATSEPPDLRMTIDRDPWKISYSFMGDDALLSMRTTLSLSKPTRRISVLHRRSIGAVGTALHVTSFRSPLTVAGKSPWDKASSHCEQPQIEPLKVNICRVFDSLQYWRRRSINSGAQHQGSVDVDDDDMRVCMTRPSSSPEVRFFSCGEDFLYTSFPK